VDLVTRKRSKINSYILIVSLLVFAYYLIITIGPLLYNIYMSLSKTDLMSEWTFIGFRNYLSIFKDQIFLKALGHNLIYILIMVPVGIGSSLLIAFLIYNTNGFAKKTYLFMFFAPVVTSLIAVSVIWRLLYYPNVGLFARIIQGLFHIDAPLFLQDPKIALLCIILMDIWKDTGLRVVVLHAGMEEIPGSVFDSARIDGASFFSTFFRIIIPLLRHQIIFLAAIYSINALRVFGQVYMMTGNPAGGPAHSTQVLVVRMYQEAFLYTKFGRGAAISMVVFIMLFGLVYLEIKSFSKGWEY
jgi:multiple sugar transport system permease protein